MLKPLRENVIVKKPEAEKETVTKGGIVLMKNDKEREQNALGVIVAVANDVTDLNIGDIVLYAKYAGTQYKEDDTEYLILDYSDILAVKEN